MNPASMDLVRRCPARKVLHGTPPAGGGPPSTFTAVPTKWNSVVPVSATFETWSATPMTPCAPMVPASSSMRPYAVWYPWAQASSTHDCSMFWPQARCSADT